jgi:hypothetical protein
VKNVNGERSTVNGTSLAGQFPFTIHRSPFTLLVLLLSCRATTSRPSYLPLPTAAVAEVELEIPEATRVLAEALARDSITLSVVREADGFIDSGWLAANTLERTAARPLGQDVVRVRAWVNPAKQFWSELVVEVTYRPMADPSRPERELDVPLPDDHPLQRRVAGVIRRLIELHGDPATIQAMFPPKPVVKLDTAKVKPDTTLR